MQERILPAKLPATIMRDGGTACQRVAFRPQFAQYRVPRQAPLPKLSQSAYFCTMAQNTCKVQTHKTQAADASAFTRWLSWNTVCGIQYLHEQLPPLACALLVACIVRRGLCGHAEGCGPAQGPSQISNKRAVSSNQTTKVKLSDQPAECTSK